MFNQRPSRAAFPHTSSRHLQHIHSRYLGVCAPVLGTSGQPPFSSRKCVCSGILGDIQDGQAPATKCSSAFRRLAPRIGCRPSASLSARVWQSASSIQHLTLRPECRRAQDGNLSAPSRPNPRARQFLDLSVLSHACSTFCRRLRRLLRV